MLTFHVESFVDNVCVFFSAAAHMALGKTKLALKDYETVFKARPNDKDASI